jgi:hypothetical protein
MPAVYSATLKAARMQLVLDLVGHKTAAASTGSFAAGSLVIGTSALNGGSTGTLATITLPATPFTISGAVLTLAGVPLSATAAANGTAALAELRDNAGAVIVSGLTVGVAGADIIIGSTAITSGQTVTINSGTITHG